MMKLLLKKTLLLAMVAALGMASLPVFGVAAAGLDDPTPPPRGELTNERLEQIWARQQKVYEKLGNMEKFVANVQKLIDHAVQNGKDVSAVQAALDAFEDAALNDAKPIYESAQEIIDAHAGFDASGKVTDSDQAKETVRALGEKMKAIKDAMGGTGKALREALQAFREANPRPEKTLAP